jgi:DNA recombination protein RmuC
MLADPLVLAVALLAGMAVLAALIIVRTRDPGAPLREALRSLAQRMTDLEQARERDTQRLREQALDHERTRRSDHAALSLSLEQRLGEALRRQDARAAHTGSELTRHIGTLRQELAAQLGEGRTRTIRSLAALKEHTGRHLAAHQVRLEQRHGESTASLASTLREGLELSRQQVADALAHSSTEVSQRMEALTRETDRRLQAIAERVDQRLGEGFQSTNATFADVLQRLALIDEAQKKITELSSNVVSLQQILSDKRSRGAFGEVQLNALVSNVLPASSYALQHTLGNGRRADCVLFLPPPTGNIVVDSKFPLESFQRMRDVDAATSERRAAARQFKLDVRAHIRAIAERYIIEGETSDGAVMFIPAEAVFAEIHAHHPDVVQEAQRARVWMASPTTLLAILNTARAVLKDEATRRQIHVIRRHLGELARDFERFRTRMDRLNQHIQQASRDVGQVHVSARKISERFDLIEQVEVEVEAESPQALQRPAAPGRDDATG